MPTFFRTTLLATTVVACGASRPAASERGPASEPAPELIDRHVALFGGPLTDERPLSLKGTLHQRGGEGTQSFAWTRTRSATVASFAGDFGAEGVDATGPWSLTADVFIRNEPDEIHGRDTLLWVFRRGYVDALRRNEARIGNASENGKSLLVAAFDIPALGRPVLRFDDDTAALVDLTNADDSGHVSRTTFEAWSDPKDGAPRLPKVLVVESAYGDKTVLDHIEQGTTPPCTNAEHPDASCLGPPPARFQLTWPASDAHVPARFALHEVLLQTQIGRAAASWGLLDSGASVSALDVSTASNAAFRPGAAAAGEATAKPGTLDEISLGGLVATNLPVIAVPVPALSAFGALRPQLFLGLSYFLSADVRFDYAKGEVVFSKLGTAPHRDDAKAIPFAIRGGRLVARMDIEGISADFAIDTGSSGGLTVDAAWAERNHLLSRANVSLAAESKRSLFRAAHANAGPLRIEAPLVDTVAMPAPGDVVGIAGNQVLQLCASAVFDPTRRTLWLEPPCKTTLPQGGAHWSLEPKLESGKTRWIVARVLPSGSAERAGIEVGDEIVRVGKVTLTSDPSLLEPILEAPTGTRVPVVLRRGGKEKTVDLVLLDFLPSKR